MKQTLRDYNTSLNRIPIICGNSSAINLLKNPIQHFQVPINELTLLSPKELEDVAITNLGFI